MRANSRRRTLKSPLIITTPELLPFPTTPNGCTYGIQLSAIGGHGNLTWSLLEGYPQPNDDLTISPSGMITYNPNGPINIDPDTGAISYPNPSPPGNYAFYIGVVDEAGNEA